MPLLGQLGSVPVYGPLTLAGTLATTAHGTGYQTTSGLWDIVKEIVWVDGCGEVRGVDRHCAQNLFHVIENLPEWH